ncbi:MAG: tRNA (guanine-N7-)-methyltransferase [Candidatus Omnitrophota bacterium]
MKLHQNQLKPLIQYQKCAQPFKLEALYPVKQPVDIEIGFGQGEYITELARLNPERNFLGVELLWDRVCKTLNKITPKQHTDPLYENVRLLKCDVWVLFQRFIARESIERMYCLFPCPWPKKKHIKNRLFSQKFLKTLNGCLKAGGTIQLVTDYKPYYDWVLEESAGTGFTIETKIVEPQYATKFEKKWSGEGQEEFFKIIFTKEEHISELIKERSSVKSYKLATFDPEIFNWKDVNEEQTIVFKERLFDKDKQKAIVHVVVSEEHLIQNIRITIYKKNDYWRLCIAEGQDYLSTEGVKRAIDCVYEAVK